MELWTREHAVTLLPALALMIVIAAVLRITIGKREMKIRMIPFQVLACILFVIELGKQAVSFSRGYDLYHLPFHFCSLFIFALPVMAFYKGRHLPMVKTVTASLCAAMSLLLFIYPCLIYSAGDITAYFSEYMSFHTVTFHNIVVFAFVLIVALDLHTPAPKGEQKTVIWFTVAFCAVSATMAQLLKTNYANYYSCNIPPLETIRLAVRNAVGAVPAQLLYILIVSLLNILFVWGSYWLYRLLQKILTKENLKVSG